MNKTYYSREWAEDVVLALIEKFDRAPEVWEKVLRRPKKALYERLINNLRTNSLAWERDKRVVKTLHRHAENYLQLKKHHLGDTLAQIYLDFDEFVATDDALDQSPEDARSYFT